jgi:hypothetical protein
MLALLRRRAKPAGAMLDQPRHSARRDRQQNIKVSTDCCIAFAALAEAQGISKAALFEDMVAERLETVKQQGVKLELV